MIRSVPSHVNLRAVNRASSAATSWRHQDVPRMHRADARRKIGQRMSCYKSLHDNSTVKLTPHSTGNIRFAKGKSNTSMSWTPGYPSSNQNAEHYASIINVCSSHCIVSAKTTRFYALLSQNLPNSHGLSRIATLPGPTSSHKRITMQSH